MASLLGNRARRLSELARQLERHGHGEVAERPPRRGFNDDRRTLGLAEAEGIREYLLETSADDRLNGQNHCSGRYCTCAV